MHLFTRQVGTGPLVVVLHGGPGASHDYLLPQYDLLAQGRSHAQERLVEEAEDGESTLPIWKDCVWSSRSNG